MTGFGLDEISFFREILDQDAVGETVLNIPLSDHLQ